MTPDPDGNAIRCPRCGYDLRGETTRWKRSCPLRGRCVECGLDIDYSRVFVHARHPWLFEYDWRSRPLARLMGTLRRATSPRRFWREVRLTDPVYLRPVAWVAWSLVLVAIVIVIGVRMHRWHLMITAWGGPRTSGSAYWWEIFTDTIRGLPAQELHDGLGVIVVLFGTPLVFALMPVTLRRARVRPRHVVRIWMYSLVGPAMLAAIWLSILAVSRGLSVEGLAIALDPWRWDLTRWLSGRTDSSSGFVYYYRFWRPLPPRLVLMSLAWIWALWWWWCACRLYLKLPRSGEVIAALGTIMILAGLVAVVLSLLPW